MPVVYLIELQGHSGNVEMPAVEEGSGFTLDLFAGSEQRSVGVETDGFVWNRTGVLIDHDAEFRWDLAKGGVVHDDRRER